MKFEQTMMPEIWKGYRPQEEEQQSQVALRLSIRERVEKHNRRCEAALTVVELIKKHDLPFDERGRTGYGTQINNPVEAIKQSSWRSLVMELNLRDIMSIKRREEVNRDIYDCPRQLPEFNEANVYSFVDETFRNVPQMMMEAVKEVYTWLVPGVNWTEYKTNNPYKLGVKVIKTHVCQSWGSRLTLSFRGADDQLSALGNVLRMLDGQGVDKDNPLSSRIDAVLHVGLMEYEDDYLHMRFFKNGNAHITFKRDDLVALINQTAANGALPGEWIESRGFAY